ncbi:MAG: AEC family transporter [Hydrogenoanaerobacterium sp.]
MNIFIKLMETAFPVFFAIALGALCRKAGLVKPEGIGGIKSLVFDVFLPAVLFNALYKINYTPDMLLLAAVSFAAMSLALAAGFALQKLLGFKYRALPFVLTSAEAGMLGYPLYILLAGSENLHFFVTMDVGHGIFLFTVLTLMLARTAGEKISGKAILRSFCSNKIMITIFCAIIIGISGIGPAVAASPLGGVVNSTLSFITAPTGALMMLALGYELSFEKDLIKPVLLSVGLRAALMGVLLAAASLLVFAILPFDKNIMMALCLFFAMPTSYVMPILADKLGEGRYISATLSVYTLVTLMAFLGLSVYSAV